MFCLDMASTVEKANALLDDEALAEEVEKRIRVLILKQENEKLLEELENEEIPSYIREARLEQLKTQATQFRDMRDKGHGIYSDIENEKAVLDLTTSEEKCVVHFYHEDFRRCAIIDKHLKILTEKYFDTKFARIDVEKAKFLVEKLKIRVLPAVLMFKNAICVDRVVGFEEIGGSDNFATEVLERRIAKSGVIEMEEEQLEKKTIFGFKHSKQDEDSSDDDF